MNKRILFVSTGMNIGGAEIVVKKLCNHFSKKNMVTLCVLTPTLKLVPNSDVKLLCLNQIKTLRSHFVSLVKLIYIYREFRPDIVHAHMFHAIIFCRILKLIFPRTKLISTFHSIDEGGFLRLSAYKMTDFLTDLNTAVSKEAMEYFLTMNCSNAKKLIFIENSVDTNLFRGRHKNINNKEFFRILNVGRMVESKNQILLIKVFAKLKQNYSHLELVIVGEGEEYSNLRNYIAYKNISDSVRIINFRMDVHFLYNECDIFVLTSNKEGFGLVVAEAMSSEMPVISTDCGGVRNIIGDAGIIINKNDFDALYFSIEKLINSTEIEKVMIGKKARERIVSNFSDLLFFDKWNAVYNNI